MQEELEAIIHYCTVPLHFAILVSPRAIDIANCFSFTSCVVLVASHFLCQHSLFTYYNFSHFFNILISFPHYTERQSSLKSCQGCLNCLRCQNIEV